MLTDRPEWKALEDHHRTMSKMHMRDLFTADPDRFRNFSIQHKGLFLDYSKHQITDETLDLLLNLAKACDVEGRRNLMFSGERINTSENRAVMHPALRCPETAVIEMDGENIIPFIHGVLNRIENFCDAVHNGTWTGHTGKRITDIVNIGIGGSDLGPKMVCEALKNYHIKNITVRFVSNIDSSHMADTLTNLNPETTLFIIASKTFTTAETMANARTAKNWILDHLKDERAVAKHFAASSANNQAVTEFGIAAENIFPLKDWVGGRYSLWSAIGLPVCLAVGYGNFRVFLNGAHAMDQHFLTAPLKENMPVLLALLGLWYRNFYGSQSYAVLPYCQHLHLLPAWLQQLDMESNGKTVDRDGNRVNYETGPAIFGATGTDCQHSFFQLIHQGTSLIPCDFIAPIEQGNNMLLANMVAQTQGLMQGQTCEESGNNPYKVFEGNNPSTTILMDKCDPYHLGMLLVLYEHKIFVQGIIWNINSFDQWGVELGKSLAKNILAVMDKKAPENADSSTNGLLEHIRKNL